MPENISSIKHKSESRAHIPSKEEAGYEDASPKVLGGKPVLELPKNPVVHRGQDPELFWMNKYGLDDSDDLLKVDIRSLYRHEHIAPEKLIAGLHRVVEEKNPLDQMDLFTANELFGNALEKDELQKVSEYYSHHDGWTNRLIQGDSHLVMASLLEREGMAGQVQMIYIDPPYGIKYNSNWQMKLNDRNVKDGSDEHLTGEPEMIKAFRDTWELGIHSYLTYLRDRLLIARELLTESGSCFVQISDENVHLVRCLMDEVFGSENFVGEIVFRKKGMTLGSQTIETMNDFLVFYAKNKSEVKYRQLFEWYDVQGASRWTMVEESDGSRRKLSRDEYGNHRLLNNGEKVFRLVSQRAPSFSPKNVFDFKYNEITYKAPGCWVTNIDGMKRLGKLKRFFPEGKNLSYVQYHDDFPMKKVTNLWFDTTGANDKRYVVQTSDKVMMRCILMTTDPGDLVLDPTCGSGTTAFVAEQWGRRWITIDTSRIALNIAKTRFMTAIFPYYHLYSDVAVQATEKAGKIKKSVTDKPDTEKSGDIRQGFVYEEVPHITLKSLANDEPPSTETLYDKPLEDKKKLRVCGPFTVETLQNYEPVSPDAVTETASETEGMAGFEERVFDHLKSAGVKNGIKNEQAVFIRIERLVSSTLHAEGFYQTSEGEKKAYFHIGPKFGTVSKHAVNEAVKECRQRGDANWLIILGFSFESDITSSTQTTSMGTFEVTKARMHDDLMQDGLMKKDKKAGSFITIGEPDIKLHKAGIEATVEICGLDIYDPIKDEVKARNVADIAYWMVDDDYDGSNFVVKQLFFCGGSQDEFSQWKKGLSDLARTKTRRNAEKTLKIEIDDEAFDRLYGFMSHPIPIKPNRKIAVRVISQFGEESMKVMDVTGS
ncbi:MAG: site-specific DNA-methyltransferase [Chlorobium sp.]|jgi:adenine-specific DNA-methyltransferase|nr:site-specific DNA-methyltransferase [Chlorobium sp.]